MINEFKTTLQQFVGKKCDVSEVTQKLEELLKKHPQLATPIDGQIKQLADSNKVTQDDYKAIHAITAAYMASEGSDKTEVLSETTSATAVTSMADEKTEVTNGDAAVDDDTTEIGADLPPSTTQTQATQGGGGFGLDLDTTGGQPTMTSPTIGPDGMPVMAHGDKVIGIGSVLRNRFELKSKLGEGGMGAVYLATDKIKQEAQDKNDRVAVKVLNETFKQFRESFIALQRESSKQQRLAHPNIATVFDFDRDYTYDTVFMTMEYMDGEPLDDYIKHRIPPEGLSYEDARPIIDGMCDGLAYAHHHNLVHSDFKPANTFVLKTGVVKLLDFGIARAAKPTVDAEGKKETTLFDPGTLGALTPAYASAEMLEGETPEPSDDIYALACVTYQLLGGKHPFNKMPANQARDNKLTPAPIKKLKRRQMKGLLKGLAFDRDMRTQTVEEFLDAVTPKKPIMLYAIAASVVILSIIGVLAQGQIKEYYRAERVNQMIASMGDAGKTKNYPIVAENLKTLDTNTEDYDEQSVVQIKADKAVQSAIVGYYSAQIDKQIDKEKGKYNYPAAYQILREVRGHYPDSGKVEAKQEEIDAKKSDDLEIQGDNYRLYTIKGPWLPTDGPYNDVPDVIERIKMIDPRHKLLTDPRLIGSYLKEIKATRDDGKFDESAKLIERATQYAPDEISLVNEKAELDLARFQGTNQKLLAALSQKVALAGAATGLNKALSVSKELEQIKAISPDNPLLNNVAKVASAGLTRTLQAAKDRTAVNNAAKQFWAIGPALSGAQQNQVRSALNKAWQQSGGVDSAYSEQLSSKTNDLTAQIETTRGKAEFNHEWTQSLKQLVGELEALVGSKHISAQRAKREIAVQHLKQATQASQQQHLSESRIQLAYAKEFDANAPGLADTDQIIRRALEKHEQEILEKVRLATIAALKEDLLFKAKAEKIEDAKKFLGELKIYLLPRDNFLVTEGPNAIGKAYARIALRAMKRADNIQKDYVGQREAYNNALRKLEEGTIIAPRSKDLISARNQINYAKDVAQVRNIFKTTEKLNVAQLGVQLSRIKRYNSSDYGRLRSVFSNDVTERIATLVVYDPLTAKTFLASAKKLPIDRNILNRIKLPEYRPSKFAKDIRAALGSSLLTKASQVLKKALTEESDHPEIKTLRGVLASKTVAAKKLYTRHKALAKTFKFAEAKETLSAALEIWKDSDEYKAAMKNIDRIVSQPTAGETPKTKEGIKAAIAQLGVPCTKRLAGYGKRSKGQCYDGFAGGQAPTLIVLPAGAGHSSPFAMTKYEISVGDYNFYCKATKKCQTISGNPKLPVTGISLAQAKDYTAWLGEITGQKYRIPSETEWLYAATAGGKQPKGKSYNCTLRLGDNIIKGTGLEDVNSGTSNGWGLVNYIGNAQEWVESSSGVKARGGAYTDAMLNCTIKMERAHDGTADKITSFRLIRDMT